MQTFLPYSDFRKCASALDNKRLGKQRVEAYQILKVLRGETKGWKNHPAVLMWAGYEKVLEYYLFCVLWEWAMVRKFKNSIMVSIATNWDDELPPWLGDERLHDSHKSNLLRKDAAHYGQFEWRVPNDLPYYWPVQKQKELLELNK